MIYATKHYVSIYLESCFMFKLNTALYYNMWCRQKLLYSNFIGSKNVSFETTFISLASLSQLLFTKYVLDYNFNSKQSW